MALLFALLTSAMWTFKSRQQQFLFTGLNRVVVVIVGQQDQGLQLLEAKGRLRCVVVQPVRKSKSNYDLWTLHQNLIQLLVQQSYWCRIVRVPWQCLWDCLSLPSNCYTSTSCLVYSIRVFFVPTFYVAPWTRSWGRTWNAKCSRGSILMFWASSKF